ncbi:MAG: hypothetical protein M0R80_07685 [Proteobacteria bacterium]|nr:hypothetical protein [Pseudomonadota bacterium]
MKKKPWTRGKIMGLSNEERFYGLCETVKELTNIGIDLEEKGSDSLMCKYLSQLWPAMLSTSSNGLFWIMGSTVGGSEFLEPSPSHGIFPAAIYNNFIDNQVECGAKEKDDWSRKDKPREEKSERELLFDYVCDFRPTIETVLRDAECSIYGTGSLNSETYVKIFVLVESAFYRINRYHDEFADRFVKVRDLLAKIWGLCYRVFSADSDFLAAYFLHHLAEKVVTYDEDVVNYIWMNQNLHHDWRVPKYNKDKPNLKDLFEMFKSVQGRRLSLEERLVITFRVCGSHLHYEHQHQAIVKALEAHNKKKGAEQISVEKIQGVLKEHCQERKDEDTSLHRYCWMTGQSEDDIKKKEAVPKKTKKTKKKGKKKGK